MNSTTDHTIDQDNCLACQEERKAPKPVENGELRETILSILGIVDRTSGNRPEQIATLEQEITAHINAEIAKVLERLESELNEQKKAAETNLAYHTDVTKNERLIRDWQGTVHGIEFCRPAIQAERAKLKEVK